MILAVTCHPVSPRMTSDRTADWLGWLARVLHDLLLPQQRLQRHKVLGEEQNPGREFFDRSFVGDLCR